MKLTYVRGSKGWKIIWEGHAIHLRMTTISKWKQFNLN